MDHETRTKIAQQQDPKLAARIVRGLKQLEDDYYHAAGPLSERMMLEAVQLIKKAVPEPFRVVESDGTATINAPNWKAARGVGQDVSIELTEIGGDEEREFCWLTAATGVGPTRLGLELVFRRGLEPFAQGVVKDDKAVAALWKAGFVRSEEDHCLFVPITVPAELLAQGFEANDMGKALAPVTKAVEQVIAAKAELDAIIEAVRAAAKGSK